MEMLIDEIKKDMILRKSNELEKEEEIKEEKQTRSR